MAFFGGFPGMGGGFPGHGHPGADESDDVCKHFVIELN